MNKYRIKPGKKVSLDDYDPEDISMSSDGKAAAKQAVAGLNKELEQLQELMYAEHKHKLLVVLQAMDTGGKDGLVRSVFDGVNPQGVDVATFKAPTAKELDHDFLWRVHKEVPGKGQIVIFNRSHYEDVLVVRVHNLVSRDQVKKRYKHIAEFERMLAEEGTTILKFYLHISKDEQKRRLEARLEDPSKHWKFNLGDLKERTLWNDYMSAYEDAISSTSTSYAPWYVVPANKKWYRDLVVSTIIVDTLKGLKMGYPKPESDLSKIAIQ
jgi:PPK2 family polyphosphate:nucleotide phosphotransferase